MESLFTALFPFGGSGGGALGFLGAEVRLLGRVGRFRCLGSIDFDRAACVDFERFTGSSAWCVDVQEIKAAELIERYGEKAPHVVFMSPPCKGSSRLLSAEKAKTEKYVAMNRLAIVWTRVMLEAWGDDPPALLLLENVPGLPQRAGAMLRDLKKMLRAHGYVFHASSHDCGEIGGLAQHRERYLLVARLPRKCPSLLYQPPKRRVRGVGEVLEKLPMPATHAAKEWGELHTMPKLSWRNWLRLALIPAGGDWRDLEGVLQGRARREVFRRHAVQDWKVPHPAVTGPGGHSVEAVADPRVGPESDREWNRGSYGVRAWDAASGVITAGGHPSKGVFSVADPRIAVPDGADLHHNKHAVLNWKDPSPTVIGKPQPSSGAPAIADPRVSFDRVVEKRSEARPGWYGVLDWDQASRTISGQAGPGNGANSVADPRLEVPNAYRRAYGVLDMNEPAPTVTGHGRPSGGATAVADDRDRTFLENVRVMTLDEAMALDLDVKKAPPFIPVIVAKDGTWHRPMTKLELAMLQSYPERINGERIQFEGGSTVVCEHIGNSVPPDAAQAVAERMGYSLLEAAMGSFSLNGGLAVWVNPERSAAL